jgi:serine/threonine protein kinase
MTTTQNKKICEGYEPIPGYVLEEVIGRGGFGEVWRASAPGGIKKAVKFVFGAQDDDGSARERRSLERIKSVQHPFILTLERFEAIDDQLVIVTELADGSLEDEFKRNVKHGSCGIPREALVSYIHDTADALDYMHEKYRLQHLDIKPGNLLIVGGHVKVADFGLVKDLQDIECSIVGGLTPIYAPPEVFDGRPSMHSDQYSLAVMYQELLTGSRPFSGRTIAQLATQHVRSAPNLESLPPSDRPVIARALEKNPERRFANCKAFVEALRNPLSRPVAVTSFGDDYHSEDTQRTANGIQGGSQVEDLPQLTNDDQLAKDRLQHHALVVALGGTGAECLRELRRRVVSYPVACPLDFHSVLIDTDKATIDSMSVGEVSESIPSCNLIHTPLRTAHEYRKSGTERLKTISRRWIYNVPRSGATEGMRPLGRLALVDHGPRVTAELTAAIKSLAAAAADSTPAVYVVGSLTGGTASGIYFDVVHLLRHLLDQLGLVEANILSFLSTASLTTDPAHPLGMHDAQAALTEMCYFLQAGNGYPGDVGAQWPSVPAARTPLRDVYLVTDSPSNSRAPSPVDTITNYIWSDTTGAGDLLAAARKLELTEGTSIIPPSVRSVGVVTLGNPRRFEQKVLATPVVRELLIRWLGLPSTAKQEAVPLTDRVLRRIGLLPKEIMQTSNAYLSEQQHWRPIEQAIAHLPREQAEDRTAVVVVLSQIVDSMAERGEFQAFLESMINNLQRELSVCLHDRRADLTTVIECMKLILEKLTALVTYLHNVQRDPTKKDAPDALFTLGCHVVAARLLENIHAEVKSLKEQLDEFAKTIAMAIVQATTSQSKTVNSWDEMPEQIRFKLDSAVLQLHKTAVDCYLVRSLSQQLADVDPNTMFSDLVQIAMPLLKDIVDEKHSGERNSDESDQQQPDEPSGPDDGWTVLSPQTTDAEPATTATQSLPAARKPSGDEKPLSVEEALSAVQPALLGYGGLQRLILIVSTEEERSQLEPAVRNAHEGLLTVVFVPGSTPKLIHEAQQVELKNVLSRLTILNGGNAQVTSRLSSRTDVNW